MKSPLRLVLRVMPLLAVLLLSSLPAYGQDKGPKAGFRDLKWKDPLPAGMVKVSGDEISGLYTRASDKMAIGDVQLTAILYGFFQKQFSSMSIKTKNGAGLLRILTENWGEPIQDNQFIKSYNWFTDDTLTGLDINEITGGGTLTIFCHSLYEAEQKVRNEKAKKAKTDL